ncbi:MAG: hypothetical protein IT371_30340 [Deltaproteobacteria bacterium]|nr:hypothetical protein [Deltaproteobacteria bacterium]
MGASREEEAVRALVKQHGGWLRKATHGDLWRIPATGQPYEVVSLIRPGASVDPRAWKNSLADVRRVLRSVGIDPGGPSKDDEKEESVGSTMEIKPQDQHQQLAALGCHVERKKKVVVTEEVEATVPVEALAKLLGLTDDTTDARVGLVVDDSTVAGNGDCVVVRVTIVREEGQ